MIRVKIFSWLCKSSTFLTISDTDSAVNLKGNASVAERCPFFFFINNRLRVEWKRKRVDSGSSDRVGKLSELDSAHLQKQSHLLVQPVPSPFSHIPPPLSLYSPYCPLACFPQCYKLRTTQTSRPKAPPWMPSKLHFLESQRLASLITPGTLSDSPIYWQAEKHKTGPSQARKTPALFGTFFYTTTAERLLLFSRWKSVPQK